MQVRRLLSIAAAGVRSRASLAAPPSRRRDYPAGPVRVIIPLARAGGAIDVMVRAIGKAFEQRNGHGFVVESRPGANTIIAANACKAAPPDGSTICLLSRSSVSLNPGSKSLSYDPLKDFEPITNLAFARQVLILNKNVPVNDFKELVAYSKQNPDKLNFGSFGIGGDTHLVVEWLERDRREDDIPFKGASDAMLAFKAGNIQLLYLIVGNPDIRARSMKARSRDCWCRVETQSPCSRCAVLHRGRIAVGRDRVPDLVRHVRAPRERPRRS